MPVTQLGMQRPAAVPAVLLIDLLLHCGAVFEDRVPGVKGCMRMLAVYLEAILHVSCWLLSSQPCQLAPD